MRPRLSLHAFAILVTAATAAGCNSGSSPPPQYPQPGGQYGSQGQYTPPGGYGGPNAPPGQYAPPQGYPNQAPPGSYAPPGQPTQPAPQPSFTLPQLPGVPSIPGIPNPLDPINTVDMGFMHNEAASVMGELISALAASNQAMVNGIPLVTDATPGLVNAFAGCDDQGMPFMAITDGLLQIEAYISQFKATDEIFGTQKLDGYLGQVAQTQSATPPPGFIDPTQNADPRKVARQHQLLDEQIAFVIGHELSHHYLGHTGCAKGQAGRSGVSVGDLGRVASRMNPVFNQPNESAADWSGTNNLLTTGARRQAYHWNEEGALMTLDFFARLEGSGPGAILISAFTASHPHPAFRRAGVQTAASTWRATGGAGIQIPTLPAFPNIFGAH